MMNLIQFLFPSLGFLFLLSTPVNTRSINPLSGLLFRTSIAIPQFKSVTSLPVPPSNPERTVGGGRRDRGLCPQDTQVTGQSMIALSPTLTPGHTAVPHPTLLISLPKTQATQAEISLFDRQHQGVYQTKVVLPKTPAVIAFTIPADAPALLPDHDYTWTFALICDPKHRRRDQLISGQIRRVALNSTQIQQFRQANLQTRLQLYRQTQIWYDEIAELYQLRRSQPANSQHQLAWETALKSVGLNLKMIQPLD
jgi:Domain of Unknown Function (DUF928)